MDSPVTDNTRMKEVAAAVRAWRVQPFARGTADCCAFADHVVEQLTGKSYIPSYETDEEAIALILEHGGLSAAVTHWMGREPVPVSELQIGDVVFITVVEHEGVGILAAPGRVATVLEDGMLRMVSDGFVDHGWKTWE